MAVTPVPASASLNVLFMEKKRSIAAQNHLGIAIGILNSSGTVKGAKPLSDSGKHPLPVIVVEKEVVALRIEVTHYLCSWRELFGKGYDVIRIGKNVVASVQDQGGQVDPVGLGWQ